MTALPDPRHPLAHDQLLQLTDARLRGRKVNRAAVVASLSGWTMAVFAFFSLLFGLFDLATFLLGLGLAVTAYVELRGARGMRTFDLTAPRRLALNQVAVAALISLYAGWRIAMALLGPSPYDQYIAGGGDVAKAIEPYARLTRTLTATFYVVVIGATVILQGCAAMFYYRRRAHMLAYLRETPTWAVDLLRRVAA